MSDNRDLCSNCQHWREEHYDEQGMWQGHLFGCAEYRGAPPDEDRRERKNDELRASRERIKELRSKQAASWYDGASR